MHSSGLISKSQNPYYPGVFDVDPAEVLEKAKGLCIVDVRQHDEYVGELGHISGSKLLILDNLPEQIGELSPADTIVFVCRSGGRSARAAAFALQNGFSNVFNMKGGMLLWNDLKLPTTIE